MLAQFLGLISQIFGLIFHFCFGSILSEARENPIRLARTVAIVSYVATFILFFFSTFYGSLPKNNQWIPFVYAVICVLPLFPLPLPLPRPFNLEEIINQILLAFCKSVGSFFCFFFFNWLGSAIKVDKDMMIMNSSLCFVIYLISINFMYEFDEVIQICDGYLFAGFGLMLGQNVIPKWVIFCVGISFCFIKECLELCKKKPNNEVQEPEVKKPASPTKGKDPLIKVV